VPRRKKRLQRVTPSKRIPRGKGGKGGFSCQRGRGGAHRGQGQETRGRVIRGHRKKRTTSSKKGGEKALSFCRIMLGVWKSRTRRKPEQGGGRKERASYLSAAKMGGLHAAVGQKEKCYRGAGKRKEEESSHTIRGKKKKGIGAYVKQRGVFSHRGKGRKFMTRRDGAPTWKKERGQITT